MKLYRYESSNTGHWTESLIDVIKEYEGEMGFMY